MLLTIYIFHNVETDRGGGLSKHLLKNAVGGALVLLHVVGALEDLAAEDALGRLHGGGVLDPDVAGQVDAGHHAQAVRAAGKA